MAAVEYTIRFANDVISFPERDEGRGSRFVATLNDAAVSDEVLNGLLSRLGAETFVPVAPHYRHLWRRCLGYTSKAQQSKVFVCRRCGGVVELRILWSIGDDGVAVPVKQWLPIANSNGLTSNAS